MLSEIKNKKDGIKMEAWELRQMQGLPLEIKIRKTQLRLREWYEHFGGEVYVSFSGGKDSTVLLDIARKMYPDIQAVFVDTGLEFPEIREFVKTINNVRWLKPEKDFKTVILGKGYPIISKETSLTVFYARKGSQWAIDKLNGIGQTDFRSRFRKYKYLLNAPFRISDDCCRELKKKPVCKYEREAKKVPIIATMAQESIIRRQNYLRTGCNSFSSKRPISHPLEARKAHLEVTREFQENIIKLEGYKGIRDATKKALQEQERAITRLKLLQTVTLEIEKNGCIDTLYDDIGQICDI